MVDLFTIFGKIVTQRAWELDESGRHSQKSQPFAALQTKRVLTGVVVQNKPVLRLPEWGFNLLRGDFTTIYVS